MPTFNERPGVQIATSNPPTYETEWVSEGLFDLGSAKAAALTLTPAMVAVAEGILHREDIQAREEGCGVHYVRVRYTKRKNTSGQYSFRFSSSGGTLHITHSRETVNKYPGTARTMNQAIDVGRDNVPRGADVVIPALKMSYTFKHPLGMVNEAYANALYEVTGTANDAVWHGMQPGEALFLGADGSDGTDAEAEVTFHVIREKNLQDLTIGGISGIRKDGHDFLWVHWQDDAVDGKPGVKPRAVYVERLYRRINFTAALGF